MALVDIVVVSYNSRETLRDCVAPLAHDPNLQVLIVDNASADASLETVADLPVVAIQLPENDGFAAGCNAGWRAGSAASVLFLNPDAQIVAASIWHLVEVLEREPQVGLVAPQILNSDGKLEFSQRRFPRLLSTYAQALFLHRLFPRTGWVDELVRDPAAYEYSHPVDWVSGACALVRRALLEQLGGWDERFFLYCEDVDLCRRIRDAGYEVYYEAAAEARHLGGASAPRSALFPILAASRIRYAQKHGGRTFALLERVGVALGATTHLVVSQRGLRGRLGHARALGVALSPQRAEHRR
ncbi:MAG: glycosyltransferase family 2 protein [Chloroflexota bacterium]|nr:glycosyltransferase family 2 protein [Chloroflexota bacterium]